MPNWSELAASVRSLLSARDERLTLDTLLSHADEAARLEERVLFLVRLLRWIRLGPRKLLTLQSQGGVAAEHARFALLFQELRENRERRRAVARTLVSIVRDTNALDLFAETGMPAQIHLWDELRERVARRLLPSALDIADLAELFEVLFPAKSDAAWIETLDERAALDLRALLDAEAGPDAGWQRVGADAKDALVYLASQVSSSGGTKDIRARLADTPFRDLPFVRLPRVLDGFLTGAGDTALLQCVLSCEAAVAMARGRLVETGVTIRITYELVRLSALLGRIRDLVLLLRGGEATLGFRFVANLVRQSHDRRDLRALLRQSSELWALKVVERTAQTGEHYITRSRSEYRAMVRMALLGGALTGLTTLVKIGISQLHLPPFYEGVFFSTNYAISFMAIQLLGGTLATKQPANTAPAIAARLDNVDTQLGMEAFILEVTHLIRSQAAGIVGNVLAVVPVVLALDFILRHLTGHPLVNAAKAHATMESLSILGPSAIDAAFTGLLLWLGGFVAGMADNWVVFRRIKSVVGTSVLFTIAFGRKRARVIGELVTKHFSGLVASAALGILLGITPWICVSLSIPLDVRHVTLSSGSVAASIASLGPEALVSGAFLRALFGVIAIGTLNVVASFSIALRIALSARGFHGARVRAVLYAVAKRFSQDPLSFLLPGGLPEAVPTTHDHRVSLLSGNDLSPPRDGHV